MNRNASSIFIVGAGKGLGASIARVFGSNGYSVGLIARSAAGVEDLADELGGRGIAAAYACADASQEPALRAAWASLAAQLGEPEVAVFNVVQFPPLGAATSVAASDLLAALAVNTAPALTMAQCAAPAMRARKRGTVFFTGGGGALNPSVEHAALGACKAALRNLALSLAKELRPDQVQVATITITAGILPGTPFDPALIADLYWRIHNLPVAEWQVEHIFRAAPAQAG